MDTNEVLNGHYHFNGYTDTKMYFHNDIKVWRLELLSDQSIYATTKSLDYPFGTHIWDIVLPDSQSTLTLNLNSCQSKSEFNCNDGICIDMNERYLNYVNNV